MLRTSSYTVYVDLPGSDDAMLLVAPIRVDGRASCLRVVRRVEDPADFGLHTGIAMAP
jgi:hypothetical protein